VNPGGPESARRSLKARALQWLAQREHSRSELRRKLLRHAQTQARTRAVEGADAESVDEPPSADPAGVDALLDWLEAHRYLSQERFVESRVHARAARFGNLRIKQELANHQLALPAGTEQGLKDSEFDRARGVWERKFSNAGASAAERAKQARFLAGRGFSAEVVRRVLREAGSGLADEETDTSRP
jgi:regulatory protein